jgi:hypothetical protein
MRKERVTAEELRLLGREIEAGGRHDIKTPLN